MQGLSEYNDPPFLTVAHYIDFFRQVLEGLSFLHEHRISGLNCSDPSSYMVDLSSAPRTLAPLRDDVNFVATPRFDRYAYPVRYYLVNFTKATRISTASTYSSYPMSAGRVPTPSEFKKDVQECGMMFDKMLSEVPQIATKFRSLIKAMTLGGFSADDSRRLFEALCLSLEARVFESNASYSRPGASVLERAQTISHPISPGKSSPATGFPPLERMSSH